MEKNCNSEKESPIYILFDVPVSRNRKCTINETDTASLLLSSPTCISLIDISLHGAYPYQSQRLDVLEMAIEEFVMKGHSVKLDELAKRSEGVYNVVVRKVGLNCLTNVYA